MDRHEDFYTLDEALHHINKETNQGLTWQALFSRASQYHAGIKCYYKELPTLEYVYSKLSTPIEVEKIVKFTDGACSHALIDLIKKPIKLRRKGTPTSKTLGTRVKCFNGYFCPFWTDDGVEYMDKLIHGDLTDKGIGSFEYNGQTMIIADIEKLSEIENEEGISCQGAEFISTELNMLYADVPFGEVYPKKERFYVNKFFVDSIIKEDKDYDLGFAVYTITDDFWYVNDTCKTNGEYTASIDRLKPKWEELIRKSNIPYFEFVNQISSFLYGITSRASSAEKQETTDNLNTLKDNFVDVVREHLDDDVLEDLSIEVKKNNETDQGISEVLEKFRVSNLFEVAVKFEELKQSVIDGTAQSAEGFIAYTEEQLVSCSKYLKIPVGVRRMRVRRMLKYANDKGYDISKISKWYSMYEDATKEHIYNELKEDLGCKLTHFKEGTGSVWVDTSSVFKELCK